MLGSVGNSAWPIGACNEVGREHTEADIGVPQNNLYVESLNQGYIVLR